jgi:hypothetical protein
MSRLQYNSWRRVFRGDGAIPLYHQGQQQDKPDTERYRSIGKVECGKSPLPNVEVQEIGYSAIAKSIDQVTDCAANDERVADTLDAIFAPGRQPYEYSDY